MNRNRRSFFQPLEASLRPFPPGKSLQILWICLNTDMRSKRRLQTGKGLRRVPERFVPLGAIMLPLATFAKAHVQHFKPGKLLRIHCLEHSGKSLRLVRQSYALDSVSEGRVEGFDDELQVGHVIDLMKFTIVNVQRAVVE
ncbi:MAG: hypothetical protein Q9194_000973 [Teloschistes cf. exilis]